METKELLKKVKKIEIKTRRLSNHIFSGHYHTSFKGRGMTFSEVRQYQYGDDFRAIDWNVSARNNDAFVKIFEEERELTMMLVIDCSSSQNFGTSSQNKKEMVTEIAATLAFSATQNNDKIGLILFTNEIELYIPPKKGKSHVLRIIRELVEWQPKNKTTSVAFALDFLSSLLKKRAIVFLISDFMTPDFQKPLQITAKKHDITGVRIFDSREKTLPNVGLIQMQDAETEQLIWLDTQTATTRLAYEKNYTNKVEVCQSIFRKCAAGLVETETNDSYVTKLVTYFKSRA